MDIIEEIIDREFEMFQYTQNVGGRASCQDDRKTFGIMRKAQFSVWSDEALESYLDDLKIAEKEDNNLITYKYGYMMESTDPVGYARIKNELPEVSEEKKELVESIVAINVGWLEEFASKYPKIASNGRHLRTSDDFCGYPSVETYLRGELKTYSIKTLKCLTDVYQKAYFNKENLHIKAVTAEMKLYGADSLEEVEKLM